MDKKNKEVEKIKKGRQVRMSQVEKIEKYLENIDAIVLNDYRGLSVENITELRKDIAKVGASMHVHKNKLARIAFANKGYSKDIDKLLVGPTALTYVKGDISSVLKILFKYENDSKMPFSIKGAYSDGRVLNKMQAEQMSKLPTKDVLLAQLMGTMNASVRNFMYASNEVTAKMLRTLNAIAEKK